MSNVTERQRAYHLQKMRTRFQRLDVNKDGFISWEDFEFMAKKVAEYSKMSEEHVESTQKAFTNIAENIGLKPGVNIPVDEAAKVMSREMLSMTPEKQQSALHSSHNALFDALDLNKDGHISLEEFKMYFQVIGPDISEDEMIHSFNTIDSNKNGEISREEFLTAAFDFMYGVEETEISKVFLGHLLP